MGILRPPLSPDTDIVFPEFVLLNASAGAGKTYQLSLRFVQFLLSDIIAAKMSASGSNAGSNLRNLLAVTFTKNAAREMKVRILDWLKGAALGEENALRRIGEVVSAGPDDLKARAAAMLDRIIDEYSDFQVDTIDSFMSGVFRASTLDLGVSPDYEIALDGSEILDYAYQRYLRRVGPGTREGDRFLEISRNILAFLKGESAFVWDPAAVVGGKLASLSNKLAARTSPPDRTDYRPSMRALEKKIKTHVERIAAAIRESGLDLNPPCHFGKWMIEAASAGGFTRFLEASFKSFPVKRAGCDPAALKSVERDWTRLEAAVDAYRGLYARGFFHPFVEAHHDLADTLREVKARRGVVVLEDVYRRLYGMLDRGEVPEVYFRLGDQIFHYLIDEFQDTSPIQWAVLVPLVEDSLSGKGSLLLVGDTKQAIYGFRNADFEIQAGIRKKDGEHDPFPSVVTRVKEMGENFRSDGKILEFVKTVFLENVRDSEEYGESAALSGLTDFAQDVLPERRDAGFAEYVELGRDDDEEPEKAEVQERVRDLRRRGYAFKDIGILTLKNESVVRIASWLNEIKIDGRSVPFIPFSSLDIRKRKVTGEILALMRFLDSPPDDLAFAAFLQSGLLGERLVRDPGSGFSSREGWADTVRRFLFARRAAGRRGPAYTAFRAAFPKIWDVTVDRLFKSVGYYPLYDLVTEIYRVFDVFRVFDNEEATLAKLLEAIKDFEGLGKNDLGEFLAAAESDESRDSKLDIDVPVDVDAVRIMSIHKAKGLGFPAVIALLYGERFQPSEHYLSEKDGQVRVLRLAGALCDADADLQDVYRRVRERDKVDRLNTLYVALTRAKHELHVVGVKRSSETYPFDLFKGLGGKPLGSKIEGAAAELPAESGRGEPRRARFVKVEARSFTPRAALSDPGVLRGIHGHAILARIETARHPWAEEVRAAMDGLEIPSSERGLAEDAGRAIAAFFEGSELARLFESRPGRRVATELEICDARGDVLRIDRAVIDPDGIVLLDFKTGAEGGDAADRKTRDRSQMDAYLESVRQIFPDRPVSGILAYIDQGRWERVP